LISISYSVTYAGLISVAGIFIGIFGTLIFFSLMTVLYKERLLTLLEKYKLEGEKLTKTISLFQGMVFVALGVLIIF